METVVAGSAHIVCWYQTGLYRETYEFWQSNAKQYGLTVFDVPLIWYKSDGRSDLVMPPGDIDTSMSQHCSLAEEIERSFELVGTYTLRQLAEISTLQRNPNPCCATSFVHLSRTQPGCLTQPPDRAPHLERLSSWGQSSSLDLKRMKNFTSLPSKN